MLYRKKKKRPFQGEIQKVFGSFSNLEKPSFPNLENLLTIWRNDGLYIMNNFTIKFWHIIMVRYSQFSIFWLYIFNPSNMNISKMSF